MPPRVLFSDPEDRGGMFLQDVGTRPNRLHGVTAMTTVRHSYCSENLISYLIFCTFQCTATSLPILFIVFEISQSVCIIIWYLVPQQAWLSSEEESVINVADSSSSMDMSTHMSSSLDWSQPITRAEDSLELKWDDDEDKSDDDDQSQRPLEMKVNPTNTVEHPVDGKSCYDTMTWVGH